MSIKIQPDQTYKVYFPEKNIDCKHKIPAELLNNSYIKKANKMMNSSFNIEGYLSFELRSGLKYIIHNDYKDYGITVNLYIGANDTEIQTEYGAMKLDDLELPECKCTGYELATTGQNKCCNHQNKVQERINSWIF